MSTETETSSTDIAAPEQLALLTTTSTTPASIQFRLDQRTRERGLAHVAAIKAQLVARAADRQHQQQVDPARHAA